MKLRPQGEALTQAVRAALAAISTPELPVTLDTSGGPLLTLGAAGPAPRRSTRTSPRGCS
ncbi:hypothetical protein ACFQDE_06455 [Deinococcus caeni]|uniref:hypothetical protein n=1 Tax=Deinococcus caeni TaxID=569127 RepID=UPI0036115A7F